MAQFVTHIQPTLVEASQGHMPHHHGHQVGLHHQSHLPHSGHNMPSPPSQNIHHNQHIQQHQQTSLYIAKHQAVLQHANIHDNFPTGVPSGDGCTSFLRSARAGNLEKVLEHLKNNIDINTCNNNGLNALHLASKDGHVLVVSELLKRGAIVDSATKKGNTALHIASLAGQEEVVKLLLQSAASVNVQSQNGFTPLYMAAQENHDSVVKLLLANGANQSLATEDGFTPLAVAMQQGHDKVVTVLLESDTRGKVRLPALHIAAKKDDVKAATLLLENDHNPDITSKSGFTPLHIASHYGNQSIGNLLIQKGANVNYLAKHNISPLHVAAKWGKANMVSVLLEKGANIEAKTRDGLTPLHCAARSGHEQVVDMLLERGAPISAKTKNGLAPLHMAAQGEHVDAARILLYHRAPVDEVTVDYLTALHVAAHCGHVRVAKLLLDRNADANARALNGFTPLHIACKKNRIKVVELLLRNGACISATTESGLTPLHVASFMGCMNIVIYLLQHDASPDVPTVRGETPLHLAARANQTDIIRILLRNGAQVDARAREQQTPLHIASRLGNVDIVMLLLQHGAQIDATTKDMYTALHIASKEGQDEVCTVLIENGAALDSSTKKGFTPLHLAAKYGHMKVTQLLLQKDADVDAQGKNGVTPLHVACHYDKQNVALILLERGASPHAPAKNGHTPLHIAARKNQMDIATTLLEYGAHADVESKAGFTPLHLSSQEGHSEISTLLLEHKVDCNHRAKNGLTAMHLCAQEDNVNVAEVIYKQGANVDAVTKAGYTPLHVASHFGQSNMVRFLLQKSANVDATTSIGYTPLHQAAQQGHCHIVNVLIEHSANANAQTATGQTPLHIARKLGYISVLDSLKSITNEEDVELRDVSEDKYRVVAPESMHETFMSDSEEEGGEDNALSDQPYRYLTVDEMKSLGDDSLPIDVTRDERIDSNRITQSSNNGSRHAVDETISPQRLQTQDMNGSIINGAHMFTPLKVNNMGFLVSFLVDARGGALRGCRHSGVKMIIPSRSACQPTRVTCRYVKPQRTMHPPQLMEGEALASRVLELGPVSVKFQGPVLMEVPHFASLRGKEREIIILRSDNGENWREHTIEGSDEIIQDVFNECFEPEEIKEMNEQSVGHVCRFVTFDFPQYFAVVSRVRQEVHAIGSEGGMVTSSVVPQVQAVFPQGALTKKIKVGLQAQPVDPDLTAKLLGRGVAVSPIVTVEPRRRKFHKAITLSMPAPKAHSQGMINQYSGNTPTLRLLCSITGGASRAQWEDVTGSTPLTFVNDCVSFTTTVSARFWLMDCRNISEATKMATELYREVIHVPFMAKFIVFAKRTDFNEAKLRVFCLTDDREDKTLEKQENFTAVAKSRDVEVLEGKPQYVEMAGNFVPVTKSGDQLQFIFKAFRENRLPFTVRVKDQHADIVGRTLFMKDPKVAKGEPPQHPICILNIIFPEISAADSNICTSDSVHIGNNYPDNYKPSNSQYVGEMKIADLSNLLGKDYIRLAPEINISLEEIDIIVNRHPNSIARQAQDVIRLYKEKPHFDINVFEYALKKIGREDVLDKCSIRPNRDRFSLETNSSPVEHTKNATTQPIHEREEIKYSAEEKEVEESESEDENQKRTVAERREKIVKRLSIERQIPASSQKKEIVQEITEIKRKSLIEDKKAIHEEEIMLQMPTDNIIKSTMTDHITKIKLNKLDAIEVSKAEFDKELASKYKITIQKKDESPKVKDEISNKFTDNESHTKRDKLNANETIQKSECKENLELKSIEIAKYSPSNEAKEKCFQKGSTRISNFESTESQSIHESPSKNDMRPEKPSEQTQKMQFHESNIEIDCSKINEKETSKTEKITEQNLFVTDDLYYKNDPITAVHVADAYKGTTTHGDIYNDSISQATKNKFTEATKNEELIPANISDGIETSTSQTIESQEAPQKKIYDEDNINSQARAQNKEVTQEIVSDENNTNKLTRTQIHIQTTKTEEVIPVNIPDVKDTSKSQEIQIQEVSKKVCDEDNTTSLTRTQNKEVTKETVSDENYTNTLTRTEIQIQTTKNEKVIPTKIPDGYDTSRSQTIQTQEVAQKNVGDEDNTIPLTSTQKKEMTKETVSDENYTLTGTQIKIQTTKNEEVISVNISDQDDKSTSQTIQTQEVPLKNVYSEDNATSLTSTQDKENFSDENNTNSLARTQIQNQTTKDEEVIPTNISDGNDKSTSQTIQTQEVAQKNVCDENNTTSLTRTQKEEVTEETVSDENYTTTLTRTQIQIQTTKKEEVISANISEGNDKLKSPTIQTQEVPLKNVHSEDNTTSLTRTQDKKIISDENNTNSLISTEIQDQTTKDQEVILKNISDGNDKSISQTIQTQEVAQKTVCDEDNTTSLTRTQKKEAAETVSDENYTTTLTRTQTQIQTTKNEEVIPANISDGNDKSRSQTIESQEASQKKMYDEDNTTSQTRTQNTEVTKETVSDENYTNTLTRTEIHIQKTGHDAEVKICSELGTESPPRPSPRLHLSDKEENISQGSSSKNELPTPKPRQQQPNQADKQSDIKEDLPTISKRDSCILTPDELDLKQLTAADVVSKTADTHSSSVSTELLPSIAEQNQNEIYLLRNMSEKLVTLDSASSLGSTSDNFHQQRAVLKNIKHDIEEDQEELETSFYIGELSSDIIIKSKPSQIEEEECGDVIQSKDKECSEISDRSRERIERNFEPVDELKNLTLIHSEHSEKVNEKNGVKCIESTRTEVFISESYLNEKCLAEDLETYAITQDNKVVRQSSETRNDLLEIETDSQKRSNEICEVSNVSASESFLPVKHSVLETLNDTKTLIESVSTALDLKNQDITAEVKDEAETADKLISSTGIILDPVLDKSETEVSEKSTTLPSAADIPLDVFLVERTLEEVTLSLDAAKEELIKVVRDGKSIKQSPSEFEFVNVSNTKGSLTFPLNKDEDKRSNKIEKNSPVLPEKLDKYGLVTLLKDEIKESVTKPFSPENNRSSTHEVDNSSSSDSYYKSGSRPCSSDFETVQTFHTASEYQTALDASICRDSTEYVSAVNSFDISGKTISSHESMRSFSSEISGNLGSMDASDLSETLVASMEDQEMEFEAESEIESALEEDANMQSTDADVQQNSMKRSQEMIFTKVELETDSISSPRQSCQEEIHEILNTEKAVLPIISSSEIEVLGQNTRDLTSPECSASSFAMKKLISTNEDEPILDSFETQNIENNHNLGSSDKAVSSEESWRRGHKRSDSTLVNTDLIKNLTNDENEDLHSENLERKIAGTGITPGDEQRGSGSDSDHDPYESEYSRAFKTPTQRKKRKEKKNNEEPDQSPEHTYGTLDLVTQTIIEDAITEEIESQIIAEERRRPSQNMQDYSNIPNITVTEEMEKNEETEHFPDSPLYKVKTQTELHKVEDTPIQRAIESTVSFTTDEHFEELVQRQYKQKLADLNESIDFESRAPDSPDSFEMVDQPDLTDEFVIIEEVAKEANELDIEGKSIRISSSKIVKSHDEEIEQILIKSAPAATNLGSLICHDDLNFDFEESLPPLQPQSETESSVAANKNWVEMQLPDNAAQLRYPYELERGILEDIKEEDVEYEIGSSRLSSVKDSFSSTPDYDVLAGRKYFTKPEHDDISMSSLQEFESLEQAISLENRRTFQGSTDSSNGSFTRRYMIRNPGGDDVSLSSLKEFEGLENACIEAHLIEAKAKEEAALLLSRSDESNNSNNGIESLNNTAKIKNTHPSPRTDIEEVLKYKSEEMVMSADSLDSETNQEAGKLIASEHGSMDSLEMNKTRTVETSSDMDSLLSVLCNESIDLNKPEKLLEPSRTENVSESTSIQVDSTYETSLISNATATPMNTTILEITENISKNMSYDSLNIFNEQTSSTATNATYTEGDSLMTDSMTSCGSSTLIDDSSIPAIVNSSTQQPVECEESPYNVLETQHGFQK